MIHSLPYLASAHAARLQAPEDTGLTFREVLADVPHDAAAAVIYLLVGVSVALIWWAHRNAAK